MEKIKKAFNHCMMMLLLCSSLVIMVEPAFAATDNMSPLEYYTDRYGSDYQVVQLPSEEVCREICSEESRCLAMSYNISNKQCHLKDSIPPSTAYKYTISAYKIDPNN